MFPKMIFLKILIKENKKKKNFINRAIIKFKKFFFDYLIKVKINFYKC